MTTLLIGFDSAWTPTNSGALAGVIREEAGSYRELGDPQRVNFPEAETVISEWQARERPTTTVVLLDQPTIVKNAVGRRPVENLVASPVSRRYGGMQPANTGRTDMFGADAPVWGFLSKFGGGTDPRQPPQGTVVFETYPVLAMIALDWMLPDSRPTGRLPKYNPARRKTFALADWQFVCAKLSAALGARGLPGLVRWLDDAAQLPRPRKEDQDGLDAIICLLVAHYMAERERCLMVGDLDSGYIVVPHGDALAKEIEARCKETDRTPSEWLRSLPT